MEKILYELARKAGYDQERWNTTEQFEKFLSTYAELVVRECADVAKGAEPFQTYDLILRHFKIYE